MPKGTQAPATVYEWGDLLAKLVHVRIGPPKESHDVTLIARAVNGEGQSVAELKGPLHSSATVTFGVDALVSGVNFTPPDPMEPDPLCPHGRLSVTVDVFLNKPIGIHDVIERIDDEQNPQP